MVVVVGSSSCLALGWLPEPPASERASLASSCPPELEGSFWGVRADLSLLVGGGEGDWGGNVQPASICHAPSWVDALERTTRGYSSVMFE